MIVPTLNIATIQIAWQQIIWNITFNFWIIVVLSAVFSMYYFNTYQSMMWFLINVLKMQAVHEGYEKDEYGGQHDNNQNYWKQKVDFVPSILFAVM